MKRSSARTTGFLAVSILIAVFAVAPVAFADPPPTEPQVTICHSTGAVSNPYVEQTVDQSSIFNGVETKGHGLDVGSIFTPDMTSGWGDIIPAFGDYPGLNWPAGEAWIKNGCMTPPPPTRVVLPTLTATSGTCTEFGSVHATNTASYTWASSGSVDATYYTATKIGNVVLVGDNPQGPYNLSQTPSQSTNSEGQCYVDPVVPVVPTVPGDPTVQPKITLKAAVVNDAGGTAHVSDFTLTGSSTQMASAATVQNSAAMVASAVTTSFSGVTGDVAITNAVWPAGTYSLSESALPSGYSASAWACTGGQLNGSAITVTFGNAVECVITNTYSSTVVDSPGVPKGHPASPPVTVLGVDKAAPGAKAPTAKAPTAKAPSAAIPAATTLAFTGAEPVPLSLLALLALVLGAALTVAGRRQGGQRARG